MTRCQPLLPVLTVLLGAVGCMVTIISEANTTRTKIDEIQLAQKQAETTNWLNTLQKIGFDEPNLIPTALLMQNFDGDRDRDRAEQARRVERIVLEETQRPETFDVVVSDMVGHAREPREIGELIEVVRQLDSRLTSYYDGAASQQPAANRPVTFETFLSDPSRFYTGSANRAQLDHVLTAMWELDTISHEMTCAVGARSAATVTLDGASFLNAAPGGHGNLQRWSSCKVERDAGGAHLLCVASPQEVQAAPC